MKHAMLLTVALLATACAGRPTMDRACHHDDPALEKEIGYCQALRAGDMLHISGVAAGGAMPEAARKVYAKLDSILKAHALTFADVVAENVYATDLDAFIEAKGVRNEFYAGSLPAATWVQVERLYLPAFVVEVQLTARVPGQPPPPSRLPR